MSYSEGLKGLCAWLFVVLKASAIRAAVIPWLMVGFFTALLP